MDAVVYSKNVDIYSYRCIFLYDRYAIFHFLKTVYLGLEG